MRRRDDYRLDALNRDREELDGDPWAEFERRKRKLAGKSLSPREYELALAELAEEIGV